jgi:hypothetical protein
MALIDSHENPIDRRLNPNKIALETPSLLDLQLKLSQHPSWRILKIPRLKFAFKKGTFTPSARIQAMSW